VTAYQLQLLLSLIVFLMSAVSLASLLFARYSEIRNQNLKEEFDGRYKQLMRKIYELSVLQEIDDHIGHSLNIQKIADIITTSLGDLIKYSSVAYAVFDDGEKIIFKIRLREALGEDYISSVKKTMLSSLTALTDKPLYKYSLEETVSRAVASGMDTKKPAAFFNVPLYVNDVPVGLINVASTVPGMYNSVEDVSALYSLAEQASTSLSRLRKVLEAEKSKLEIMVESLSSGVFYVDSEKALIVVNKAARDLLGLSVKKKVKELDILNAFPKSLNINEKIDEAIKLERDLVLPEVFANNKFMRVVLSAVKSNSQVLGVAVVLQDMSDEKLLERMREDFTSMVVHDLRAPLSVMYGVADILAKRSSDLSQSKTAELIGEIKESSRDMINIVNNLLDVAKIEAGKFTVKKEPLDIVSLIRERVRFFKTLADKESLYIKFNSRNAEIIVPIDKEGIGRVLSNLLSNGIKYTKEGGITISALKDDKKNLVKVGVSDTGCGITKEQKKSLFSKFEQMQRSVDSAQKSTGLGLVIAKGIVEAHGGNIWVESDGKTGSTFYFTLPLWR